MSKIGRQLWWKVLAFILLAYTIFEGFKGPVPNLPILEESIRNLYFHVPMWFSMILIMLASMIFSIRYLSGGKDLDDVRAFETAKIGFFVGFLGIVTGMVWARSTWGAWWVFEEVKLNAAAAGMLVYAAYFVLRNSVKNEGQQKRFAAVYSIFAFVMYIVLIMVIPRIAGGSLHPGNGGNPGFSSYDLDNEMRRVFYPAVVGWTLLAAWMINLNVRLKVLKMKKLGLD